MNQRKFKRQEVIGNYIADFVCHELSLIIELDGGQHQINQEYDLERTEHLKTHGYKVVRFWNNEITENLEGVLEVIFTLTLPSPIEGEGSRN